MKPTTDTAAKAAALTALAMNFGRTFDKELLRMWLALLEPYSPDRVKQAVLAVIASYEFKCIPPFAVLKKHLDGAAMNGFDTADAALAEWNRLQVLVSSHGVYDEPELHPTTAFTLGTMGGWQAACSWQISDLPFRRKEFLETWERCHGRADRLAMGVAALERLSAGNEPRKVGGLLHRMDRRPAMDTETADDRRLATLAGK